MKKRVKGVKLSRKKGGRLALAKSLAQALILKDKIKTTRARAKFAQKYAEKLVTLAKKNSLSSKRKIFAKLGDKQATKKLIEEIGPKFTNVNSGFTRIVNLGLRRGDAAPLALLEFTYRRQVQTPKAKGMTEKTTMETEKEVKNETGKKRK